MNITISRESDLPVYQQIVNQVRLAVASGELAPEERLSTIKDLSISLRVNPNTIARAYRELESAGIVVTRGTLGTFVAPDPAASRAERKRILEELVEALLSTADQLQVSTEEVLQLLREKAVARKRT